MSFVREYRVGGRVYLAKVESYRVGDKVRQRYIGYLGVKCDGERRNVLTTKGDKVLTTKGDKVLTTKGDKVLTTKGDKVLTTKGDKVLTTLLAELESKPRKRNVLTTKLVGLLRYFRR